MTPTSTRLAMLCGLSLAAACADNAAPSKPSLDPDLTVDVAKADATSNGLTSIRGPLTLGKTIADDIDWPDYYLGRTLEMRAGQTIEVKVSSNRASLVRFYGPAYDKVDGQPLFKKPVIKANT